MQGKRVGNDEGVGHVGPTYGAPLSSPESNRHLMVFVIPVGAHLRRDSHARVPDRA